VGRDELERCFVAADLVGLQNWTMLPHMSDIWEHVLTGICPKMPPQPRHTFFFDLADPEKTGSAGHPQGHGIDRPVQEYFDVYLGLNEKESFHIGEVVGYKGARGG